MTDQTLNSVKTLSLKEIGIKIPKGNIGDYVGKTVAVLTGVVNGYFFKNTNFGESICLTGQFMIANALTGEVYDGGQIYLPADFAKQVAQRLDKSAAGEVVELNKLEIHVAASERSSTGYTYIVRNMSTLETVNKKKAMAAELLSGLKALPAPEVKKEEKATKTKAA